MTLTQLNYILAVDQYRNFGAAAEACFVTQPTLSMQVQKLEEELGAEIFDRSRTPTQPTPVGRLILDQARLVTGEARRLVELVRATREDIAGPLRLGVIPTLAPSILPLFIGPFTAKYPKLQINVEELQTQQIVDRLKADTLDIGILVTPLVNPNLIEHPLFQEPFLLYCAPDHPLLKTKSISQKDLSTKEIWLLTEGHCFRDQVISLCSDTNRSRTSGAGSLRFESGNLETLKKMVDQAGGYTLLPQLATDDISDPAKRKRLKAFSSPIPTREVSVIHHRMYAKQAIVEALMSEIQAHLPPTITKTNRREFKRVGMKPV